MGHSLSADKRERQNLKRRHRNRGNTIALKKELKRVTAEIATGKAADPKAALSGAFKALDRAARKNTIPKKRADRKKSRLALAANRAAKTAATPKS
ncbi:MAG TPA: 30S ribosomal protein S20 [Planctomycetota bacterium]|nr:30S ribosomal protein S20 [Planctomycetota bacterium]